MSGHLKKFSDEKNFPYGFRKSGAFSIKESQLLEEYGCLLHELSNDKVVPESSEQHRYLDFLNGKRCPENEIERVWKKYQNEIIRKHQSIVLGKGAGLGEDENGNEIDHATIVPKGYMTQRHK